MFKVVTTPEVVEWPVKVQIARNGGKHIQAIFTAKFKRLKKSEVEKLSDDDDAFLDDVLVSWDGVADEDGTPLEFNSENRDTLLDLIHVRTALAQAYFDMLAGAKRKNS